MSGLGGWASVGTVATAIVVAFVLGATPVFVVRLIARIYPKGDPRRAELIAEMAHVKGISKTLETWRWLGESFATALCEGTPERVRRARRPHRLMFDDVMHLVVWDREGRAGGKCAVIYPEDYDPGRHSPLPFGSFVDSPRHFKVLDVVTVYLPLRRPFFRVKTELFF